MGSRFEQMNRWTDEQMNRGTEEQRNRGTEEQRNRGIARYEKSKKPTRFPQSLPASATCGIMKLTRGTVRLVEEHLDKYIPTVCKLDGC